VHRPAVEGAGASRLARAATPPAARAAESQRRALLGNDCCGWLEAAGLAAELFERNPSCQSAPARPGAASRLGPLAWRDGRRFAVVRASRSASRAEMRSEERRVGKECRWWS